MQEYGPVYSWEYTQQVLRQSLRIQQEARQAVEQARAEIERAKKAPAKAFAPAPKTGIE